MRSGARWTRQRSSDSSAAAATPATKGETSQPAAISAMPGQFTASAPNVASPAPAMPPTTACVVLTGAPAQVARLIQIAAASSAATITEAPAAPASIRSGSTIPRLSVVVTRWPASITPASSATATSASPVPSFTAPAPTAGPSALVTSLAPIASASQAAIATPTATVAIIACPASAPNPTNIIAATNSTATPSRTTGRAVCNPARSVAASRPRSLSSVLKSPNFCLIRAG